MQQGHDSYIGPTCLPRVTTTTSTIIIIKAFFREKNLKPGMFSCWGFQRASDFKYIWSWFKGLIQSPVKAMERLHWFQWAWGQAQLFNHDPILPSPKIQSWSLQIKINNRIIQNFVYRIQKVTIDFLYKIQLLIVYLFHICINITQIIWFYYSYQNIITFCFCFRFCFFTKVYKTNNSLYLQPNTAKSARLMMKNRL